MSTKAKWGGGSLCILLPHRAKYKFYLEQNSSLLYHPPPRFPQILNKCVRFIHESPTENTRRNHHF